MGLIPFFRMSVIIYFMTSFVSLGDCFAQQTSSSKFDELTTRFNAAQGAIDFKSLVELTKAKDSFGKPKLKCVALKKGGIDFSERELTLVYVSEAFPGPLFKSEYPQTFITTDFLAERCTSTAMPDVTIDAKVAESSITTRSGLPAYMTDDDDGGYVYDEYGQKSLAGLKCLAQITIKSDGQYTYFRETLRYGRDEDIEYIGYCWQ